VAAVERVPDALQRSALTLASPKCVTPYSLVRDGDFAMVRPGSGASFGAVWPVIRTSSAKILPLRRVLLGLLTLLALTGNQRVYAGQCFTDGPRYQLESDSVEWRMKIRSNFVVGLLGFFRERPDVNTGAPVFAVRLAFDV
jgi:hypothetical protein